MITDDGMLEIEEGEGGTYVFPNSQKFASTWALYVYSDGCAELYTKRDLEKGTLLGKPIDLGKPVIKIHPLDLSEMLNEATFCDIIKTEDCKDQCIFEIRGERYFQTVSVPAKTKNLR